MCKLNLEPQERALYRPIKLKPEPKTFQETQDIGSVVGLVVEKFPGTHSRFLEFPSLPGMRNSTLLWNQ